MRPASQTTGSVSASGASTPAISTATTPTTTPATKSHCSCTTKKDSDTTTTNGDSAGANADFIADADAPCKAFDDFAAAVPEPETADDAVRYFTAILPLMQALLADLQALGFLPTPPSPPKSSPTTPKSTQQGRWRSLGLAFGLTVCEPKKS